MDIKENLVKLTPTEADWIGNNARISRELRMHLTLGCIVSLQALSGESLPVYEKAFRTGDALSVDSERLSAERERYAAVKKALATAEDGTEKPILEVALDEAQKRELYEGIVRDYDLLESLVVNAAKQRLPIEQRFFDEQSTIAEKADAVEFEAQRRIDFIATWRMVDAMKAALAAHLRLGEEA